MTSPLRLLLFLSAWLLPVTSQAFRTVVIDAGHGGRDIGGAYGKVYEKWLALDTALRLEGMLQERGFKTVMTRRSDRFLSLGRRAQIGNSYPDSVFVSIHYNFTWKQSVQGLETFYCTGKSRALAQAVHQGMMQRARKARPNDRGVKHARYFVIRKTRTPSILVEGGFVSNSQERGRTKEGWYREALAQGIADGIVRFRKSYR